jgi:hypothetical protein
MGIRDKINAAKAEQEQQTRQKPQSAPQTSYTGNGTSPFDKLDELAAWADIFEPAGWKSVDPGDTETLEAWQHPAATHPISAKVLKKNPHVVVVWSTSCGLPDGPDQNLTKARVYAHLWHNGNESAAAIAMLKGEAHHLPTHIREALKSDRPFDPLHGLHNGTQPPESEPPPNEAGGASQETPKTDETAPKSRWIDLNQFLDGTYTPPQPSVGAIREDGIQFLYPGMWHTNIALTTAGKTTFALWQVKAVLEWGGHVIYIHFEEANPNGIIHRLRALGVSTETIRKQFHWGHVNTPWKWGELAAEIQQLEQPPQLAVLDGINAACGMHNWPVKEPESVGLYRAMFVHPLTKIGAAVLSLGHPPKATNRQSESYSYGAAGWLNDVDGVGYRMTASKTPIGKGRKGSSALYSVKDRYGEVERWGELQSGDGMPWHYMGQFVVDDTPPEDTAGILPKTRIHVTVPAQNEEGGGKDKIDALCGHIVTHLRETTGRFESVNKLTDALRAKGVHFTKSDVAPALLRLADRAVIEWPDVADRKPRPGWLTDSDLSQEEE